jgi:hypothetical protein
MSVAGIKNHARAGCAMRRTFREEEGEEETCPKIGSQAGLSDRILSGARIIEK